MALATRPVTLTTGQTDLVTMIFATWLMIGLFLDGYAHANLIDEIESFFTPWHAVFYSGFLATTAWVVRVIYKNTQDGLALRQAIPGGYGVTVIGLGLFGLGGIGDGIWHTVFGVEAGIDALLSPTHFMLFTGGVLGLSTAIRTTRLRNPGTAVKTEDRLPLLLSLLLVTAALAFFSAYMWAPGQLEILGAFYSGATGEGQGAVAYFIASLMVSTLILLFPLVVVLKWWAPPRLLFLPVWALVCAGMALSFGVDLGVSLVFGLVGGATAEILAGALAPGPERRWQAMTTTAVTPAVAWAAFWISAAMKVEIIWPVEIWTGSIVLAGLAGLGLGWLALPSGVRSPVEDTF